MPSSSAHAMLGVFAAHDLDRAYIVPGESYLAILDALVDFPALDVVVCRHEAGAGFMAVADARLTGRPGLVMVSRGPGASNAAIAVHTAQQDALPLILVVGQVPVRSLRRGAFQEIDYQQMYGSIAKWVFECTRPEDLPEAAQQAVRMATTGTPGPVVLVVPEDIQQQPVATVPGRCTPVPAAAPADADLDVIARRIARAQRPLLIAGGAFERPDGREALQSLAEAWQLPVALSFRRHDVFPNSHPLFVGELGLANTADQLAAFQDSDLVIALGTRLGDVPTQGYTFPATPVPAQDLIHCHADPAVVGRHARPTIALACDPVALAAQLAGRVPASPAWQADWLPRLRSQYLAWSEWPQRNPADGVDFSRVVHSLHRQMRDDGIVCLDAGTFAAPVYRHYRFDGGRRLLSALAGAMGYGTPAALAAALRLPGRQVVCLAGDGGFLMTGNEMILAVERRLPIVFIVSNNASYASIRLHQEHYYPGRVLGTNLHNPDFVALARAYGMAAERLTRADDIDVVVARCLASEGPCLLEVDTSLAAVLP